MADETAKPAPSAAPAAEEPAKKLKKKKLRPTNCVQSNKRIRRKDWYYRNGKYFANKKAFKLFAAQEVEKARKAKEATVAAAAQAAEPPAAEQKTA
ncbi:MAG: hypothetical protein ACREH5_07585 [Candidatus Omnitrophota bacterium]